MIWFEAGRWIDFKAVRGNACASIDDNFQEIPNEIEAGRKFADAKG
jgi:hypothetical protein